MLVMKTQYILVHVEEEPKHVWINWRVHHLLNKILAHPFNQKVFLCDVITDGAPCPRDEVTLT